MASPSVTYTFTNGTTADATQVNTNFTDVLNSLTDGSKDLSISALTVAGIFTANGNVTLGNSTADDVTVTGSLASSIPVKTDGSYDIGSAALGLRNIYLGDGGGNSVNIGAPSLSSDWSFRYPTGAGTDGYSLETDGSGNSAWAPSTLRPGKFYNLGLAAAQTSVAADSIKIQGAGATLSSTNILRVTLPSTTAGLTTALKATSDVTINLTGAHWGLGTLGDFSDVELRVYAINHNGSLVWGVSLKGGLRFIADTDSDTTSTNITSKGDMLVSSSLSSGTWPCFEVGWFNANFDDTGGTSEDLWAVQTGVGDLNVGIPVKDRTSPAQYSPTASNLTGTHTFKWYRDGEHLVADCAIDVTGIASSTILLYLPAQFKIDLGALSESNAALEASFLGTAMAVDATSGPATAIGRVEPSNNRTYVRISSSGAIWSATAPFTWASGDGLSANFRVPILQWSSN